MFYARGIDDLLNLQSDWTRPNFGQYFESLCRKTHFFPPQNSLNLSFWIIFSVTIPPPPRPTKLKLISLGKHGHKGNHTQPTAVVLDVTFVGNYLYTKNIKHWLSLSEIWSNNSVTSLDGNKLWSIFGKFEHQIGEKIRLFPKKLNNLSFYLPSQYLPAQS